MTWLVSLVAAALLAGCSAANNGEPATAPRADAGYHRLYASLCQITDTARFGDGAAARTAFFDRAHQPLHDLARDVAAADRRVAGSLHEAKQAAEAALQAERPAAEALERLTDAVYQAVATVETPPAPCATRDGT